MIDVLALRRKGATAYAAAVAIVLVAIGGRLAFADVLLGYPFLTIFPAIVLSTFIGGLGPGLLTMVVGGFGAWAIFMPGNPGQAGSAPTDAIALAFYVVLGGFMVWIVATLHAVAQREHKARVGLAAALEEKAALLQERELLLSEVRHRVGNNLQQITGLIGLHARRITDPVAKAAFRNARARINLFADVHRSLYRNGGEVVELDEVLASMTQRLISAQRPVGVACRTDVDPTMVWRSDKAVPLIMVAHELVSNALEHGFGADGTGTIVLALKRAEAATVRLSVTDDGRGLPADAGGAAGNSLGLGIIRAFARQLNGTFSLRPGWNGRGTIAELVFDDATRPEDAHDSVPARGLAA